MKIHTQGYEKKRKIVLGGHSSCFLSFVVLPLIFWLVIYGHLLLRHVYVHLRSSGESFFHTHTNRQRPTPMPLLFSPFVLCLFVEMVDDTCRRRRRKSTALLLLVVGLVAFSEQRGKMAHFYMCLKEEEEMKKLRSPAWRNIGGDAC